MRAVFVDASDALADVAERLNAGGGVDLRIHRDVDVTPDRIPAVLGDAEVFGYLMADTIRHAARAYAGNYGMTEDEALQAIVAGLSAQLREQATEITTIQDGSLN